MKRHEGKGKLLGWRFGKIPQSFHDIRKFSMGKAPGKKPENLALVEFTTAVINFSTVPPGSGGP